MEAITQTEAMKALDNAQQLEMWAETTMPTKEISLSDMEALCTAIAIQRDTITTKNQELKDERDKLDEMEYKLLQILEDTHKTNYASNVGKFSIVHRASVKVPVGEARKQFFNFLQEQGEYDALVTVNSQTLNAYYKQKFEKATEEGRELVIPGLNEPTISKTISLRTNQ